MFGLALSIIGVVLVWKFYKRIIALSCKVLDKIFNQLERRIL